MKKTEKRTVGNELKDLGHIIDIGNVIISKFEDSLNEKERKELKELEEEE